MYIYIYMNIYIYIIIYTQGFPFGNAPHSLWMFHIHVSLLEATGGYILVFQWLHANIHLCAPKILHVPPSLTGCRIPFLQGDENPINIGNPKTKPNQNMGLRIWFTPLLWPEIAVVSEKKQCDRIIYVWNVEHCRTPNLELKNHWQFMVFGL